MKLMLEEMREIAKTLPVGYYLGRKVPVTVEEYGGAYCDIVKSEIHIGMGILQRAADHIDAKDAATWDRETMLRCLLYHEVGHLLLTPTWTSDIWVTKPDRTEFSPVERRAIVNIFEDERLERVLESYFLGVKFRDFVRLVSKDDASAKDTDLCKIFDAIRLRNTTPDISAAVDAAVRSLSSINRLSNGYGCGSKYGRTLNDLVKRILTAPEQKSEQEQGKSEQEQGKSEQGCGNGEGEGKGDDKGDDKGEGEGEGNGDDKPSEQGESEQGESEQGESEQGESEQGGDGDAADGKDAGGGSKSESEPGPTGKSESDEEGGATGASSFLNELGKDFLKNLAAKVFVTPTEEVSNTLTKLAVRLAKKKGSQAAGRWSALHGHIDVRRDALDKERIFRRSSDVGERINQSVHLTLWVDRSGSFRGSVGILNQILAAAGSAMKMSNGKLDVDVVKMGEYAVVSQPSDWQIVAEGDNDINRSYHEAWKKTRKKGKRNIDIVVFDGAAAVMPEPKYGWRLIDGKPVEQIIWNHPDCYIISDNWNHRLFDVLDKAHKTFLAAGYAERLQAEVLKILDRIL